MGRDHEHDDGRSCHGMSRRGFIGTLSTGVIGAAVADRLVAGAPQRVLDAQELSRVTLRVNGVEHTLLVEPRMSLLYVLRDGLGLTGTKPGCERGECGACTVLIDGQPRYSCMTLALDAQGHEITTIEGLMNGEELGPVQKAFVEEDGFQCGYCTPGQVMAAEGLLRKNPDPTVEQIREAMSGNLCRCGAYGHIVKSVQKAARLRRG